MLVRAEKDTGTDDVVNHHKGGDVMSGRELLFTVSRKDFRLEFFRSGGKGGQHQNKTESGVRIVHLESGAVGESREERSQHANRKKAMQRLVEHPNFKKWLKIKAAEKLGILANVEKEVEREMSEENLVVEVRENGRWVKAK